MKRFIAKILICALVITAAFAPVTVKAESPGKVAPPVITDVTTNTITVKALEGYEYSMDGSHWRTTNVFTRLAEDSGHKIYQRLIDQPETISDPVPVRTRRRTDGTVPAVAPQVEQVTHNSITLVQQEGYEYRINGGAWQSRTFNNLQPDTQYTVEQRVRLSSEELAGPVSQPLVVRTAIDGPSSQANNKKVLNYLNTNGVEDEEGTKGVGVVFQDQEGGYYALVLCISNGYSDGKYPAMQLYYDGSETNGLMMEMDVVLHSAHSYISVNYTTLLVEDDMLVDRVHSSVKVEKDEYCADYKFTAYGSGGYISSSTQSQLGMSALEMLCMFWDEMLYAELGFGLRGLGFTSYEGQGKTFCDQATGYHLGTPETKFAREAGCVVAGSTGVTYCSVCGQIADQGKTIKAKGAHTYDSECDIDCNDCGQVRWTRHNYAHSCGQICYVCGYERKTALELHTPGEGGLCVHCGESARSPGDISGDGKVNMGDTAKLYAHIRGNGMLTDPLVLTTADLDGNGKINMGDMAKLYAMIRGTN